MPKLSQVSLTGGEVSPSLYARVDLARYATSLRTCRNFFVRATGGASNRAGLQFVYALDPDSLAALIPFVFSSTQSYMMVFQENTVQVYSGGAYVANTIVSNITSVSILPFPPYSPITINTAAPHGLTPGMTIVIAGVVATGSYLINGSWTVATTPSGTQFTLTRLAFAPTGAYSSGGTVTADIQLVTPYTSNELADLRYTQSADVLSVVHQNYIPHDFIRTAASSFTFGAITDFEGGPFLDDNTTAITITSSAATGLATLTASAPIFFAEHVGSLIKLSLNDVSGIPPWEPTKLLASVGVNPLNLQRRSNGKAYVCVTNEAAGASGTYTGTVPPSHDEGIESDGDGNAISTLATRAGVEWEYLHSGFGIARISAVGGGGTTATVDIIEYMPVITPITTDVWAFGAWSEDQGYPALTTYYGDRQVFANTPEAPQTEWASKTGDYHNFGISAPLVADDAIRQPLNARQINEIVELIPMEQLIALTSSSSWASPKRGEVWTPLTIGYDPQSYDGGAFLRAILTGESALFAQFGGTKVRDLAFKTENDKFRGEELTVLARHLFGTGKTIVDMDYAKEPHGILWIVRSDGALIGLTYLKEQEVIGWHRHDTEGFFERVCVIPEDGRDVPYFVVRRSVNGQTVRYLERMAVRDNPDVLDSFFVDSGLTYDGRNTSAITVLITGASYAGAALVTLTSSIALFEPDDIGDGIYFPHADGNVRAIIQTYTDSTHVIAELQSPVPVSLQAVPTATWTFARDTFSNLGHLEGCEVAILADGCPEPRQVVEDGQVVLAYPAGVVHVGLPFTGDLETLDVTIFGSQETIRDNAKVIPRCSVLVEQTLGLKAGPNAENLYDLGLQPSSFDYTAPWPLQDEVQVVSLITNWSRGGRVLLRQDHPLPATVLAINPTIEIGEDG